MKGKEDMVLSSVVCCGVAAEATAAALVAGDHLSLQIIETVKTVNCCNLNYLKQ